MQGPNMIVPKRTVKVPERDVVIVRRIRIGSETSETRTRSPARKARPRTTSGFVLASRRDGPAADLELPRETGAATATAQAAMNAATVPNLT
jgi:hypothetical protein